MPTIYYNIHIFIDTVDMGKGDFYITHDTENHTTENTSNPITLTVKLPKVELKCRAIGYEYTNNQKEVHIYGVLFALFPELCGEKALYDWQVAYLRFRGNAANDRFKLTRSNPIFITQSAKDFMHGYFTAQREHNPEYNIDHVTESLWRSE